MSGGSKWQWVVLETWSPAMFLLAGGLFVVFAGFWAAFAFTDMSSEAVQNVVGPAGWTASFIGLLGLYPSLADRSPRMAAAGAVFAALGVVGGSVSTVGNLLPVLGGMGESPAWLAPIQLLLLFGIVLGFLTAGIANFRTHAWSKGVGLLLLAPAIIFLVNIVRVATLGSTTPTWSPFVLGSGQAIALLGIGYMLRTEPLSADDATSSVETTAR